MHCDSPAPVNNNESCDTDTCSVCSFQQNPPFTACDEISLKQREEALSPGEQAQQGTLSSMAPESTSGGDRPAGTRPPSHHSGAATSRRSALSGETHGAKGLAGRVLITQNSYDDDDEKAKSPSLANSGAEGCRARGTDRDLESELGFYCANIDNEEEFDTDLEMDDDGTLILFSCSALFICLAFLFLFSFTSSFGFMIWTKILAIPPCLEWLRGAYEHDPSGMKAYVRECNRCGVIPVSYFQRHIHDNEFVMRYYGLGPLGAKAIAKPLGVRSSIVPAQGWIRWFFFGGGGYGFFHCANLFFFLLLTPNQKQTLFPSQAKEQAPPPPHISPAFCQFCEQTFYLLQFAEQTIFSSLFAEQSFFFKKKNPNIAPSTYHLVTPN